MRGKVVVGKRKSGRGISERKRRAGEFWQQPERPLVGMFKLV